MDKIPDSFSSQSVLALLSALSVALKTAGQAPPSQDNQDLFCLLEKELDEFSDYLPEHRNLDQSQLDELALIKEIFRQMRHSADWIMMNPDEESEH